MSFRFNDIEKHNSHISKQINLGNFYAIIPKDSDDLARVQFAKTKTEAYSKCTRKMRVRKTSELVKIIH